MTSKLKQKGAEMPRKNRVRKQKGYETPEVITEILNRRRGLVSPNKNTRFYLSPTTNEFFPKSLPKNGDTVQVISGYVQTAEENNFLRDIEFDDGGKIVHKAWVPEHQFYIGQFVTFFVGESSYTYQIRKSDFINVGIFFLITKGSVVKQPGKDTRTNTKGGSMGSFSR